MQFPGSSLGAPHRRDLGGRPPPRQNKAFRPAAGEMRSPRSHRPAAGAPRLRFPPDLGCPVAHWGSCLRPNNKHWHGLHHLSTICSKPALQDWRNTLIKLLNYSALQKPSRGAPKGPGRTIPWRRKCPREHPLCLAQGRLSRRPAAPAFSRRPGATMYFSVRTLSPLTMSRLAG